MRQVATIGMLKLSQAPLARRSGMLRRCSNATFRSRSSTAFTLIELLVVISVIALLLSILIPSLRGAREMAKSISCLSNLRQMGIAAQHYAGRHRDRYPIAYYQEISEVSTMYAWDFTTVRSWSASPPTVEVKAGLLWMGMAAEEVHQCPSYVGGHNWIADPYTGYNYNTSYIGHGAMEAIKAPARISDVRDTAFTALFGDGRYGGGANKFMRAPWSNPGDAGFSGRSAGTQGFCHSGKTNVAFCDGHAESWSQLFIETYEFDKQNVAEGTGFLSEDNSLYDLK